MIALHTDTFPGLSFQKIPLKDINSDLSYTLNLIHFTLILILFQFFDFAKKGFLDTMLSITYHLPLNF